MHRDIQQGKIFKICQFSFEGTDQIFPNMSENYYTKNVKKAFNVVYAK